MVMKEIDLKKAMNKAGENHLNSKIDELTNLYEEIVGSKLIITSDITNVIHNRINLYQKIIRERYL